MLIWQVVVVIEKITSFNKMMPVIIQHIIRQMKKYRPSKIVQDEPQDHSTFATVAVLVLALIILLVALN